MTTSLPKLTGTSLLTGTLIAFGAIILHPSGGDTNHILTIHHVLTASHAIIILSLPLLLFGFSGLSMVLSSPGKISNFGLIMMGFSLIAAMFAAVLNGISQPRFIQENHLENPHSLSMIGSLISAISAPLTFIFIAMSSLSVFVFSLSLIKLSKYCQVLGYFGMAILTLILFSHLAGLTLAYLLSFQIFVILFLAWSFFCAILLITGKIKE